MRQSRILLWITSVAIFLIPFFWFPQNVIDLGGDSTRLYFLDPLQYIKHHALFGISPSGSATEVIGYYSLPYVSILFVLKSIFHSSNFLVSLYHGFTLLGGFLFVYLIVQNLITQKTEKKRFVVYYASILAGIVYIFVPSQIQYWEKVLMTQHQFFLNPLIFYLLLKYVKTKKNIHLYIITLVSFSFSQNFSFAGSPGFIAFFPISIIFLLCYSYFILKEKIKVKPLVFFAILIFLVHSFHILPTLISLFSIESSINSSIFSDSGKYDRGLSYFLGVLPQVAGSFSLLAIPQLGNFKNEYAGYIIIPIIICIAFILISGRKKKNPQETGLLSLLGVFFIFTYLLVSGNTINLWNDIYIFMFSIPGFSMFRSFYEKWNFVYVFYYSLLFGVASIFIFEKLNKFKVKIIFFVISVFIVFGARNFINGQIVKNVLWQSNNVRIGIQLESHFIDSLYYLEEQNAVGKVLTLPLTDFQWQVVTGVNGGGYSAPSFVSFIAGKQDFSGLSEFLGFKDEIVAATVANDYTMISKLLGFLNINTIFLNNDPKIRNSFPTFPFEEADRYFPTNSAEYHNLISKLNVNKTKVFGQNIEIYQISDSYFSPTIYAAERIVLFSKKIDDWRIPLSLYENSSKLAVLEEKTLSDFSTDDTFIETKPLRPYSTLVNNSSVDKEVFYQFSRFSLDSLFYPVTVLKEDYDFKFANNDLDKLDIKLGQSTKRINEIETNFNTIKIEMNDDYYNNYKNESELKTELLNRNFNSFENVLARYSNSIEHAFKIIQSIDRSDEWKLQQKSRIHLYLVQHYKRIYDQLYNQEGIKTDEEISYIQTLVDNVFEELDSMLKINFSDREFSEYNISELSDSQYIPLVNNSLNQDQENISLRYENVTFFPTQTNKKIEWDEFNKILFSGQDTLTLETSTFDLSNKFDNLDDQEDSLNEESSIINEFGYEYKYTISRKTDGFYKISFDYQSQEIPFVIKVFQGKQLNDSNTDNSLIYEEYLKKDKVTTYYSLVKLDPDADYLLIQLKPITDKKLAVVYLDNLKVKHVNQPKILLKPVENTVLRTTPSITFLKINPSLYKVKATDVNNDYILVFNQAYNPRWKLYYEESDIENIRWYKNIILSIKRFFLSERISEDSHFVVNGGVNAWVIKSENISNSTDHIVIEHELQSIFYISAFVSLVSFVSTILLLFWEIRRKKI